MPRAATPLTAAKVRTAKPGRYGDGDGLFLLVREGGARFWVFRYRHDGRMREMGLGRAGETKGATSLAEARTRAGVLWRQVKAGTDPLAAREAEAADAKLAAARSVTFAYAVEDCLTSREAGWRNSKHRAQWRATLTEYAMPVLEQLPVSAIDPPLVLQVLKPIWAKVPETAARVRGRIEAVLSHATTSGWRTGPNPAAWKGNLENVLPRRSKVRAVRHHPALPWQAMPEFWRELRRQPGLSAFALQLLILTATRTSETLRATWREIDLERALWVIPGSRMKGSREHRIPLSDAALAVLEELRPMRATNDPDLPLFPGANPAKPLSSMAIEMLLRRMNAGEKPRWVDPKQGRDITAHGMRSAFRDWAEEIANAPGDAERALAHARKDAVEAAYARSDLFERRRLLMDRWAAHVTGSTATIIQLARVATG